MKKTETKIYITDFPKELHYLFEGATIYDSSSHPTMTTLYSTHGYYIKYAGKGSLKKDAELGKLFFKAEVFHIVLSFQLVLCSGLRVKRPSKGTAACFTGSRITSLLFRGTRRYGCRYG